MPFFDVFLGGSHTGNAPTTSVPLASCKATSPGVAAAKPHWLCVLMTVIMFGIAFGSDEGWVQCRF